MVDLISKLTEKDIETIETYRKNYGDYDSVDDRKRFIDTKTWLRDWEYGKQDIANIFGGALYVEFPINISATEDLLHDQISKLGLLNHEFYTKLENFVWDLEDSTIRRRLNSILGTTTMTSKIYGNDTVTLEYENDEGKIKKFTIQKGMKLTSIYAKINKFYKLVSPEVYEDFRQKYSLVFNNEKLKGTYVLSIRPFDYMTMSDNDYDWSSCMSWMEGGCYRRGTIEMMNSPYVVLGYLKGEKPMRDWPEIDNKKWRCMFIVHPNILTSIKSYPYYNAELITFGVNKLKKLAEKNLGYCYEDEMKDTVDNYFNFKTVTEGMRKIYYHWVFETDFMYNDFGTHDVVHFYYVAADEDEKIFNEFKSMRYNQCIGINYSGAFACAVCGKHEYADEYNDVEGLSLTCQGCSGLTICPRCGRAIYSNDDSFNVIDYDDAICSGCIEDYSWIEYLDTYVPYDDVYSYQLVMRVDENTIKVSSVHVEIYADDYADFKELMGAESESLPNPNWGPDLLIVDPNEIEKNWEDFPTGFFEGYYRSNKNFFKDLFFRTTEI